MVNHNKTGTIWILNTKTRNRNNNVFFGKDMLLMKQNTIYYPYVEHTTWYTRNLTTVIFIYCNYS